MSNHKKLVLMLAIAFVTWSLSIPAPATQSRQNAEVALKNAMEKETIDGDLKAAIAQYQAISKMPGASRAVVAKALLQLAGCYEKQGNAEARKILEQLVKDYADQPEILSQARARLNTSANMPAGLALRKLPFNDRMDTRGPPSPDGRYLAYGDASSDLAVFDLTTGGGRKLTHKEEGLRATVESISWSPDGRTIAYIWNTGSKKDICLISPDGANKRVLFSDEISVLEIYGWLPDQKALLISKKQASQPRQIFKISTQTGDLQLVRSWDKSQSAPLVTSLSANGLYLAYSTLKRDLFLLTLAGGDPLKMYAPGVENRLIGWSGDGRSIFFTSNRGVSTSLWRINVENGGPVGNPELIKEGIGAIWPLGVTANGAIFYSTQGSNRDVKIAEVDFINGKLNGSVEQVNTTHIGKSGAPAWSTSGGRLAYLAAGSPVEGSNTGNPGYSVLCIWSARDNKQVEFRLKIPLETVHISWTPDERYVLGWIRDLQTHTSSLMRVDSRSGEEDTLTTMQSDSMLMWSRDGSFALQSRLVEGTRILLKRDCRTGNETEKMRISNEAYLYSPDVVSPDATLAAIGLTGVGYSSGGRLLVLPMENGEPRELVAGAGTMYPLFWSLDGRTLFYIKSTYQADDELWRISLDGGKPSKISLPPELSNMALTAISLHPDGKRIAFESRTLIHEYWVMENIPPSKTEVGNRK